MIYVFLRSEDRVRKGAEKLLKLLNAKQQGRLDGFFTLQPKEPKGDKGKVGKGKGKGTDTKGKDTKGKETKAGTKRKAEEKSEESTSKKGKTKK